MGVVQGHEVINKAERNGFLHDPPSVAQVKAYFSWRAVACREAARLLALQHNTSKAKVQSSSKSVQRAIAGSSHP